MEAEAVPVDRHSTDVLRNLHDEPVTKPALRMLRCSADRTSVRLSTALSGWHLWQLRGAIKLSVGRMSAIALALGMIQQDLVVRTGETEHAARNLLDEIGIRGIRAQQRNIALELGAHGLEAQNLELKSALALEQLVPRLEAVSAFDSMKGEVGRKT